MVWPGVAGMQDKDLPAAKLAAPPLRLTDEKSSGS